AILGLVPGPRLMDQLLGYIERVLPADAASVLAKTLGEIIKGARRSLVSLGVLGALWGASSGMVSISNALNVAFEMHDTRTWWRHRLEAIALTVGFSLLTIVALLLFVFGERIGDGVAQWLGVGAAFTRTWKVTRGKRPLGRGLSAVDQQDTLEAGRDAEASGHVGCGAAVGNVEHGDTRVAAGRKVALERGEEPDFDAHRLSGRWSSERRGDD